RAGGRWRTTVHRVDGHEVIARGEFVAVDAPRRGVQTRCFDWEKPSLTAAEREGFKAFLGESGRKTTISFSVERIDGGSRVTVRDDGFEGSHVADPTAAHWETVLGWLATYATSGGMP